MVKIVTYVLLPLSPSIVSEACVGNGVMIVRGWSKGYDRQICRFEVTKVDIQCTCGIKLTYLWALDSRSPWNLEISVEGRELDNSGYRTTCQDKNKRLMQRTTCHCLTNFKIQIQLKLVGGEWMLTVLSVCKFWIWTQKRHKKVSFGRTLTMNHFYYSHVIHLSSFANRSL